VFVYSRLVSIAEDESNNKTDDRARGEGHQTIFLSAFYVYDFFLLFERSKNVEDFVREKIA